MKQEKGFRKKGLTKKSENMADWYNNVVVLADLADYSEVKGSMIIKANGYALWEKVQATLDQKFKEDDIKNYYFPLMIPYYLLKKEKEHLEGFSPELAVVTHAGGEKLSEPYVLRPTSETIMYKTFADWIHSYRDLPLKINQWCNIIRWEKRTYPFLRTTEFLWQEGHTVHQTEAEAVSMALKALKWYEDFYKEHFAISPYIGIKSDQEKFAGAKTTYSIELVIPNGKALQAATSHNLGDNFSKVFNITFLDNRGEKCHPWQTSWGLSTRSIGGLVLIHGDDSGLILPPKVADPQLVILVIPSKQEGKFDKTEKYSQKIYEKLVAKGLRVKIDREFKYSLGYRINEWEIKGVPLRLEIGNEEVSQKKIRFVRRDNFEQGLISINNLKEIDDLLVKIQKDMLSKSDKIKRDMTKEVNEYKEFKEMVRGQKMFLRAFWCGRKECEEKIKQETKLSTRVLELKEINKQQKGKCIYCGQQAKHRWLFAQSY
ncbi:MAG: proline--tRNA ligase [Patescibacteria group bacterium]|jgi:prolyl-tRNA synthetase|nr:proline--tRNA ligase [Patescibacteria group bacterium]MDD5172601.1 proline--tRNA ligase [Patescibacteria group bacterium]